jgi:hypothetical protein
MSSLLRSWECFQDEHNLEYFLLEQDSDTLCTFGSWYSVSCGTVMLEHMSTVVVLLIMVAAGTELMSVTCVIGRSS